MLALSNTFEIAMRDEPLSVQRGVIAGVHEAAGRRGVFEFPYTGDVYVVDAITNNPGAAGGALIDRKGNLLGVIGREIKNSLSDTWMNYAIPVSAKVDIAISETVKDKDGKEKEEEKTVTVTMPEFVAKGMKGEYKPVKRPTLVAGEGGYHGIIFVPNVLERTPAYVEDVVPDSPAAKAGHPARRPRQLRRRRAVVSIKAFHEWFRKNTRPGRWSASRSAAARPFRRSNCQLGAHRAETRAAQAGTAHPCRNHRDRHQACNRILHRDHRDEPVQSAALWSRSRPR